MEQNNALARKFNAASLLRFALPNIAMMLLLSMYTIVDGMFISRFAGTTALSAINMSYPLNCLQMATGIMLGTGGSAIIARRQGEGRTDEARRNFTMLIAVALGIGLIDTYGGLKTAIAIAVDKAGLGDSYRVTEVIEEPTGFAAFIASLNVSVREAMTRSELGLLMKEYNQTAGSRHVLPL